jgi:hypothetical protein
LPLPSASAVAFSFSDGVLDMALIPRVVVAAMIDEGFQRTHEEDKVLCSVKSYCVFCFSVI